MPRFFSAFGDLVAGPLQDDQPPMGNFGEGFDDTSFLSANMSYYGGGPSAGKMARQSMFSNFLASVGAADVQSGSGKTSFTHPGAPGAPGAPGTAPGEEYTNQNKDNHVEMPPGMNAKCFPGDATTYVQGRGPRVPLRCLVPGDMLLCADKAGNTFFSPFLGHLHAHEGTVVDYISIKVDGRDTPVRLSPEHMIFVNKPLSNENMVMMKEGERGTNRNLNAVALTADKVAVGDELLVAGVDTNDLTCLCLHPRRVVEVTVVQCKDAFAPLTENGTLLVEGVLCSSYADIYGVGENFHDIAHLSMAPLRVYHRLLPTLFAGSGKTTEWNVTMRHTEEEEVKSQAAESTPPQVAEHMHPYAAVLNAVYGERLQAGLPDALLRVISAA